MDYKERIESRQDVMLGKAVIKGTRITVELILQKIASGFSFDDITGMYPNLRKEDIQASLEYAAGVIGSEEMIA